MPIELPATDKLHVLRRLDQYRSWESLDDKRQCIRCGEIISGKEIEVVGGTRGLGPLRLQCPSENCPGIPMDWILPQDPPRLVLDALEPNVAPAATNFSLDGSAHDEAI